MCPEGAAHVDVVSADPAPIAEPTVEAGVAGASAQRQYERRRQKREDYARARLGQLGVVLARLIAEPQRDRAWQRGASGETHVGKRLEKHLAGTEIRLLHDRRIPGRGKANIDHIAIGPGGVTVIDTKNVKGKVRVQTVGGLFAERRTILEIGGRDQTRLVKAVGVQIEVVRTVVAETEFAEVDIAGALCFANAEGLPAFAHQELRGVTIDSARRVAKVANRPGTLDASTITGLWQLIGAALPPA